MASTPSPPVVQKVVADAAQRAGVPAEQVRVVRVEEREWRDSSLGCPEPGKVYTQVITPGLLVLVEAGGRQYEYHTGRGESFVLCSRP
jgi:hypothetical protein